MEYVLGLAFSRDKQKIVLIEKQKPEWQKGLLNGVGGKIDPEDSSPDSAMIREFHEETGVIVNGEGDSPKWEHFATLVGNGYKMYCYRLFSNLIFQCETKEEELIMISSVSTALKKQSLVGSLQVLIPMALDEVFEFCEIKHKG